MNIKYAILISFVGHCCVLTPLGNLWFLSPHKKTTETKINYYKLPVPKIETSKKQPGPVKVVNAASKTVQVPKEEMPLAEKPQKDKSQIVKRARPQMETKEPEIKPQEVVMSTPIKDSSSTIAQMDMPTSQECISYYKYIRDEITRALKHNYTSEHAEGYIDISFVISRTGDLVSLAIDDKKSSSDTALHSLTHEGIKRASPFKPFPSGLVQKQVPFHYLIEFKHR